MENNYPPAGTWDVIDRHGEPRYVVEHDGEGGWWGVCQPDRPEDCYVLAASKDLLAALKTVVEIAEGKATGTWDDLLKYRVLVARAEGK